MKPSATKRKSTALLAEEVYQEIPGDDPPSEFVLFTPGYNVTSKGTFLFDEQAAQSVMGAFHAQGVDLMLDYEHLSLRENASAEDKRASGWFKPKLREDGALVASEVRWTPAAEAMIRGKEFRYTSPAFHFDQETMRVERLINTALANRPATVGQLPLVAATQATTTERDMIKCAKCQQDTDEGKAFCAACCNDGGEGKQMMTALAQLLGCENTPVAVLSAATKLHQDRSEVMTLTAAKSPAEVKGVILAWKQSHENVATLAQAAADREKTDALASIEAAKVAGKIPPAMVDFWKGQAATAPGRTMLTAFLSAQVSPVVNTVPTGAPPEKPVVTLTAEEKTLAASWGISEEKFKERKEKLLATGK